MATHANSTSAPARQRGLLPLAANRREIPGSSLAAEALRGVAPPHDTLAAVEADFAGLIAQPWPAPGQLSGNPGSLRDETAGRLLPAAEARALYMRRRLGEVLEHATALLDALDLPPLALDVIDGAIAALDDLEADDEDKEPWLVRPQGIGQDDPAVPLDAECEPEHDEDHDPAEETSLETYGRGFVRCGADDEEEDDGCERGEEYGSEDGEDIGHYASQFAPRPLSRAERAEVALIAGRAVAIRRALHV